MPLYTKSRFKLGLECPTKLYYNDHRSDNNTLVYKNILSDDTFLQILADGGHMVGELAKFYYHNDPVNEGITVTQRGYEDSIAETERRILDDLDNNKPLSVIAEAAIRHGDFFIRVDVLVVDHTKKIIKLVEVKSKSVSDETLASNFKNKKGSYQAKFLPYLYDVAFQTVVTENALPRMFGGRLAAYALSPILMLVNKDRECDTDSLHQFFRVIRDPESNRDVRVEVREGIDRNALGRLDILQEIDMDAIVNDLRNAPVPGEYIPDACRTNLETFMDWSCRIQQNGERFFCQPDKRCKSCQFRTKDDEPLKSGIRECWAHAIETGWLKGSIDDLHRNVPLVTDLWGGLAGNISMPGKAIEAGHAFVKDIQPEVIRPGTIKLDDCFNPFDRRVMQIELARLDGDHFRIHREHLQRKLDSWEWPLHMIDFETTAPAVPFFGGLNPYSTIAFQFSHHIMDMNPDRSVHIRHANQFISTDANVNPGIAFVRSLRTALMPDGTLRGTVFRYSSHENSVLRGIRREIDRQTDLIDREELITFIDLITEYKIDAKNKVYGAKNMVDLLDVVLKGYYSKHAGGSNSLKYILPAILKDSLSVASIYDKPGVYGQGLYFPSLNFQDPTGHVWLREDAGFNPYHTLPPIFDGLEQDEIDELVAGMAADDGKGTIDQGGLAMAAYNYTQYVELGDKEREAIRNALLKYCELDTLAMCMLTQGLMELAEWRNNLI